MFFLSHPSRSLCRAWGGRAETAGRKDPGERDRGGGGDEVRPRVHLPLLRHGRQDADVRDGEPPHPHRREEGMVIMQPLIVHTAFWNPQPVGSLVQMLWSKDVRVSTS